jgi:hypothetical protein
VVEKRLLGQDALEAAEANKDRALSDLSAAKARLTQLQEEHNQLSVEVSCLSRSHLNAYRRTSISGTQKSTDNLPA